MGGINSLMRGSIGEVVATHPGRDFANRFIDEILAVIGAVGEQPSASFVENARQLLTLKDSAQTSSMYRDLISGRPIEADQIIGNLIARGKSAGMETPYLSLVYTNLLVFQNRRA
jgi:2-dehydropantoate 2-reductase